MAYLQTRFLLAEEYLAGHDNSSYNTSYDKNCNKHSTNVMSVQFGGSNTIHQLLGTFDTCGVLGSAGLA